MSIITLTRGSPYMYSTLGPEAPCLGGLNA